MSQTSRSVLPPQTSRRALGSRPALALGTAALGLALLACVQASAPTPAPGERATSLAQTAAAILTATAAFITPPSATPLPSTTPRPTATLTPAPSQTSPPQSPTASPTLSATPCENDSAFVTDVTVPDRTRYAPGTSFVKTWRLRNDGVCVWTVDYTFRHIEGEAMTGASVSLTGEVAPGATVDLSVTLTAPSASGTYSGTWQLHSPAGEAFGTKPYVEIVVP